MWWKENRLKKEEEKNNQWNTQVSLISLLLWKWCPMKTAGEKRRGCISSVRLTLKYHCQIKWKWLIEIVNNIKEKDIFWSVNFPLNHWCVPILEWKNTEEMGKTFNRQSICSIKYCSTQKSYFRTTCQFQLIKYIKQGILSKNRITFSIYLVLYSSDQKY